MRRELSGVKLYQTKEISIDFRRIKENYVAPSVIHCKPAETVNALNLFVQKRQLESTSEIHAFLTVIIRRGRGTAQIPTPSVQQLQSVSAAMDTVITAEYAVSVICKLFFLVIEQQK